MMHLSRSLSVGLWVVLGMWLSREMPHGTAAEPADLCIGVAETDITPPGGFPMAGYYHERLATGTLDPLKAKAFVFRVRRIAPCWWLVT